MKTATIKLTAAITLGGGIAKAGEIIEVSEEAAKSLMLRGKAELATAADEVEQPEAEEAEAEAEATAEDEVPAAPKKSKK